MLIKRGTESMASNDFKSTDGLMRHLRDNGIDISGSRQKRLLINSGYYHGYKGYRFYKFASNRLPFTTFDEVYSTIHFDTKLKSLFYEKIMFIETALKNIALDCIMNEINSNSIQVMYEKAISSYKNCPEDTSEEKKRKYQTNKLSLQGSIQAAISRAYSKENPKITHFYNNIRYNEVPLWALFEIITMGDFGYLLSCLTYDIREKISKEIGINLSCDTKREVLYKFVYALKDLRNAVAHNDVIYDTRFKKIEPTNSMKQCLKLEIGLPYINFKTLGDYVVLVSYFLKLLKVPKSEIKSFINEYEKITSDYTNAVNSSISNITIHTDLSARITILKNYI